MSGAGELYRTIPEALFGEIISFGEILLALVLDKLRLSELEIMRFGILGTGRYIMRPVPRVWDEIRYSIKKRACCT